MRRLPGLFLAPAFWVLAEPAAAGIPIPCTGEAVVSVVQTPPDMRIPVRDGQTVHVDLGYKFNGCSGGDWVAYPGAGRAYYRLEDRQLRLLLASARLKDFPERPSYLMHPFVSWSSGRDGRLAPLGPNKRLEAKEDQISQDHFAELDARYSAPAATRPRRVVTPHAGVARRAGFGRRA